MTPLAPVIEEAVELAAEWHDRTYRKSRWRDAAFRMADGSEPGIPVLAHVVNVAIVVQRAGWDDATVAAAVLHDLVEDANALGQGFDPEELLARMGPEVAARVHEVSEVKFDAEGRWRRWQDRKDDYVRALASASPEAVAISLADKLHNVWTMNRAIERGIDVFTDAPGRRRLVAGPERQAWFVNAVLEASTTADDPRLEPLRAALRDELRRFGELTGL